jgi:hypothetical protein
MAAFRRWSQVSEGGFELPDGARWVLVWSCVSAAARFEYGLYSSLKDLRREVTREVILEVLGSIAARTTPPANASPSMVPGRSENCERQSKALFTFCSNSLKLSPSSSR